MQNLIRRGKTWYARLFVPRDRWADVGKAMAAQTGIKREVVRTLQTPDIREAKRRLQGALAAMSGDVDTALKAARLPPLTDWTADWRGRAVALRAAVRQADDSPVHNVTTLADGSVVGDSDRDAWLEEAREEAAELAKAKGPEAALEFRSIVASGARRTIQSSADHWLAEVSRARRQKTVAGHRKVFADLDAYLREHETKSLLTMTFADFTRPMAGEFIAWRRKKVSAAAVKREFSAPMGLWRWAMRRGYADSNPWTDQTAGMDVSERGDREDDKRAFTTPELVALIRATGEQWAPNGGGYAATLWDAVRLALMTGLRAAELADLRISDVVDDGTAIQVRGGKTRNARRRVPLPRPAQTVISERLANLPDTSPEAPLWPELPTLKLTNSRGGKLSDRFRLARDTLLPDAIGVDFHSLRRSYVTALETAMNAGGRINPAIIASLMGHARSTMALEVYSSGATPEALANAVADLEEKGFPAEVEKALEETAGDRPPMTRFAPVKNRRKLETADA
ncbi:MAG TPA: tyrosine-type recombinase/integrase [Rhodopila sp.]|uniref:tyrosine-type recombinase/integrase n=1 Tax=Rhodopila sp. TaxID=2480087 RepID=UPI002C273394|nr:tyrosine-type recombinase/integrase [Rhodopila sp.]HVY16077.1 tyrosine-type recombinase/integrase [Rhodopila sp.]